MNTLQTFSFQDHPVRVFGTPDNPLFCAADVCGILEIANHRDAIASLDDDEKDGVGIPDAIGRVQETTCITESGLYALAFKSRKPEAKTFRKWVTSEVLPSLRKTGVYLPPGLSTLDHCEILLKAAREQERRLAEHERKITETHALAVQANSYEKKMLFSQ